MTWFLFSFGYGDRSEALSGTAVKLRGNHEAVGLLKLVRRIAGRQKREFHYESGNLTIGQLGNVLAEAFPSVLLSFGLLEWKLVPSHIRSKSS